MLRNIERLRKEQLRLQGRRVWIVLEAGQPPVEVRAGSTVEITYKGERRRIRVSRVLDWGLRALDLDRSGPKSFRFDRMAEQVERPQEE